MKCVICSEEFYYIDIKQLIMLPQLCNNCMDLFIFNEKNVKINKVCIKIYYLQNYKYLIEFENKDKLLRFNNYIIKKHASSNDIIVVNKNKKRQVFMYYHSKLFESISTILKHLDSNSKYKIKIFELIPIL